MADFEKEFVFQIKNLGINGPGFANLVQDSLREMLGEAGSSVVLFGMKREVMENPESFARTLSRILESGAAPVFNALTEGAMAYTKRRPKGQSAKELLEKTLEGSPEEELGAETVRQALLHDFIMRDEMQEYMERKAKEESEDR